MSRPPRWSRKTDALVRAIAEQTRPGLQSELGGWIEGNPRFSAFVVTHQDKIRKKFTTAEDEEARLDIRAELLLAYRMLADRRFDVAFEAYGAGVRGPDLSIRYRINQRFNLEVTRIRAAAEDGATRLANVIAGKLRQMPADAVNGLAITSRGLAAEEAHLESAARLLKAHNDRGDDAFFARRGLASARDFYRQYLRLSGVFVVDEATSPLAVAFWSNREARHPLPQEIVNTLVRCLTAT